MRGSQASGHARARVRARVSALRMYKPPALAALRIYAPPALAGTGIVAGGLAYAVSGSDAADAVITVDLLDRVADAIAIGRRTVGVARQSVLAGLSLSTFGMGLAAAGLLVPVAGALFQEAIDVATIVNALRALRG